MLDATTSVVRGRGCYCGGGGLGHTVSFVSHWLLKEERLGKVVTTSTWFGTYPEVGLAQFWALASAQLPLGLDDGF